MGVEKALNIGRHDQVVNRHQAMSAPEVGYERKNPLPYNTGMIRANRDVTDRSRHLLLPPLQPVDQSCALQRAPCHPPKAYIGAVEGTPILHATREKSVKNASATRSIVTLDQCDGFYLTGVTKKPSKVFDLKGRLAGFCHLAFRTEIPLRHFFTNLRLWRVFCPRVRFHPVRCVRHFF